MGKRCAAYIPAEASWNATHFFITQVLEAAQREGDNIIINSRLYWLVLLPFLPHWRNNLLHLLGAIAEGKATVCTEQRQVDEHAPESYAAQRKLTFRGVGHHSISFWTPQGGERED